MKPENSSMFNEFDIYISILAGLVQAMFTIAQNGRATDWFVLIFKTVGSILLGILVGYIANKTDVDMLHTYHDLAVSLSVFFGKIGLDKLEEWAKKRKVEKYLGK